MGRLLNVENEWGGTVVVVCHSQVRRQVIPLSR